MMKTRSLTEGAMLGAVTVLITVIGEYLGFPPLIVPVPLMILVYRHGFRLGTLTSFVAAIISALVAGHVLTGLSIIIWGFTGIALGMALSEKFDFPKLMLVGVFSNLVVLGLDIALYSLITGKNLLSEMLDIFISSIEQAIATSEKMGVASEGIVALENLLTQAPFFFKWGLPAFFLIYAVGMSFLTLAVTRLILRRMKDDAVPWISPFTEWRIPSFYGLFLVAGLLVTSWGQQVSLPPIIHFVGINLLIIFFNLYLIMGLSIVWYFFKKRDVPKFFRIFFVIMLFSMSLLPPLVTLLALADGFLDLRKLDKAGVEGIKED